MKTQRVLFYLGMSFVQLYVIFNEDLYFSFL